MAGNKPTLKQKILILIIKQLQIIFIYFDNIFFYSIYLIYICERNYY
jgi:hypothetical protein